MNFNQLHIWRRTGQGEPPFPLPVLSYFFCPAPKPRVPVQLTKKYSALLSRYCSFSFSETLTPGTGSVFIVGSCIVRCMMFTLYMHFWTLPTRGQRRPGHDGQHVSKYHQMSCGSRNHSQLRTTALLNLVFLKLLMIRNKSPLLVFPVLLEASGIFLLPGGSFRIPLWLWKRSLALVGPLPGLSPGSQFSPYLVPRP